MLPVLGYGAALGKLVGPEALGATGPKQVNSGIDPNLTNVVNAQYKQAKATRENIPNQAKDLGAMSANDQRRQLAQNIAQTRRGASSRGLLYSGLRQGEEAGQRANTAAQIAQNQAQINQQLEDNAFAQEVGSFGNLTQLRNQEMADAKFKYDQAMAGAQAQAAAKGGLFGLGGLIGGTMQGGGLL